MYRTKANLQKRLTFATDIFHSQIGSLSITLASAISEACAIELIPSRMNQAI